MIYPIYVYGSPILKKQGKNIKKGEFDVKKLVEDMYETMESANGVGLAAPQIGKSIRIFVINAAPLDEDGGELFDFKQVFINPQIIEETGNIWKFEEGCLSIPDIREKIGRREQITLEYFDENWKAHKKTFNKMKARIIQHEYDHIEGILFTDHISQISKRLLKKKLANISKGKINSKYPIKTPLMK